MTRVEDAHFYLEHEFLKFPLTFRVCGKKIVSLHVRAQDVSDCETAPSWLAQPFLDFLSGRSKEVGVELVNPKGSAFQQKVWRALKNIPYGETRSYKEIAEAVGSPKAYRAVGMANHRNPLPIVIPCHRVIHANGALGGYAGGARLKKVLLELESRNI